MITKKLFGTVSDNFNYGKEVYAYTLANDSIELTVMEYGATILRARVNTPAGWRDTVCGYDALRSYEEAEGYLGAVVGRIGNRICRGKFTLDGVDYSLYINNGVNHLHGGKRGFDKKLWTATVSDDAVTFSAVSPDGEEGYPGTLTMSVTYTLTAEGGFKIAYRATTDKKTILNLTNHAYFNLAGEGYIGSHKILIDADRYLPTDDTLIPTGEIKSVKGTPFDFTEEKLISEGLEADDNEDIVIGGGIDHCLVFADRGEGVKERATVTSPDGSIVMKVFTDRPCVQFYSGNFLGDERYPFRGGKPQQRRHAFCLETQSMPDAINHENFLDCTLSAGEEFVTCTEYRFSVK